MRKTACKRMFQRSRFFHVDYRKGDMCNLQFDLLTWSILYGTAFFCKHSIYLK